MYSCPVVDLYMNSGITTRNLSTFTFEGVHPTDEGYLKISDCILGILNSN